MCTLAGRILGDKNMITKASIDYIVSATGLGARSVDNTLQLLAEGGTVPFIARYRKERTGNLDEVQIGDIVKYRDQYDTLEKRKETIRAAIQEQGLLSDELNQKITRIKDLTTLEDIYLPYKKKRKTKAEAARQAGLEPLAKIIMAQRTHDVYRNAQSYVRGSVKSVDEAIQGAQHIIAEWVNERSDIRSRLRQQLERYATIETKVVTKKKDDQEAQKYRDYFKWSESLSRCPSHRLLAILRAEDEGYVRLKVTIEDDIALDRIAQRIIKGSGPCRDIIEEAIADCYKRLLYPSLSNERLSKAKLKADEEAIAVFGKNLRQLLLGAPLGEQRILAIDPGFRTGCKLACISAQGELLHHDTIYPNPPQNDTHGAEHKLMSLVSKYDIQAIAIGDGTASRETERLVKSIRFDREVEVFVVSEAGASIYSASKIAREEFPDKDVTVRGAVSIGRRLADPLAELVKIDAKSIGVGQYQHDVDQSKLKQSLDQVVSSCVNLVGVNVNTASVPLLSYVAGVGEKLAENIVNYRAENGPYTNRNQIKKVPRLGAKVYEQSAGFLRVKNGSNPLDNSAVHPESYHIVKSIAQQEGLSLDKLIGNASVLDSIDLARYVDDKVGLPTLKDIVKELKKPGVDVREKAKTFSFDPNIRSIEDVRAGQVLPGIVNNITNFGCFVNIGIKESGLVHVSNLADTFVKDVNDHVSLHQQVMVRVISVDLDRKRIQLGMEG